MLAFEIDRKGPYKVIWSRKPADILNASRDTGRNQGEINVANRDEALEFLLNLLQLAATTLVIVKFGGKVTNALQPYGFTVEAKVPPKNGSEEAPA